MKKRLLSFLFLFLFFSTTYSQDKAECSAGSSCVPTLETSLMDYVPWQSSFYEALAQVPVKIHVIYGSNNPLLTDAQINASIQNLNNFYNQYQITFYRSGTVDLIFSDEWCNKENVFRDQNIILNTNHVNQCMNVYYTPNGYSMGHFPTCPGRGVIIDEHYMTASTFPHEVGHYFFLFHTFETIFGTNCNTDNDEIKRTHGDLIIATSFDSDPPSGYLDNNCNYIAQKPNADPCGNVSNPPYNNLMAYYKYTCPKVLVSEQVIRIKKCMLYYEPSWISIPVTMTNISEGGNNLGGFLALEGLYNNIASGTTLLLPENTLYMGKTSEQYINENKHWAWSYNDNITMESYRLREPFYNDENPYRTSAIFKIPNTTNFINRIEGLTFNENVPVEFSDPWYTTSPNSQLEQGNFVLLAPNVTYRNFLNLSTNSPAYYQIRALPSKDVVLTTTGAPSGRKHKFSFLNWSSTGTLALQKNYSYGYYYSPVVFTGTSSITLDYKVTNFTSNPLAGANTNQPKFVKDEWGRLHHVYENNNQIYYEMSANDGVDWNFQNFLTDRDDEDGNNVGSPSIDYYDNYTVIVYQNRTTNSIIARLYQHGIQKDRITISTNILIDDAMPVVAIAGNYDVAVVWKNSSAGGAAGLYSAGLKITTYEDLNIITEINHINLTAESSTHPNLAVDKSIGALFHLAFDSGIDVNYATGQIIGRRLNFGNPVCKSTNSPFTYNTYPVLMALNDGARITWDGKRMEYSYPSTTGDGGIPVGYWVYKTVFRDVHPTSDWTFWSFGVNTHSSYIQGNANIGYLVAWNEKSFHRCDFTNNSSLSNIYSFPGAGDYIQLTTGYNRDHIKGMIFNNQNPPYFFFDKYRDGILNKESDICKGREAIISKDSARFYFCFGDIKLDNAKIEFREMPDTLRILSIQDMNKYSESETFTVTSGSNLSISTSYGITDTLAAYLSLSSTDTINAKVLLMDSNTNEVLGQFNSVNYTKNNICQFDEINYLINTQGLSGRSCKFALAVSANYDAGFSLNQKSGSGSGSLFQKTKTKNVYYNGYIKPEMYSLEQNYPNPFNPETTLKFKIVKSGYVSLKIYDVLGKEVKTLVDEYKNNGEYQITFDASKLSSGVYIYQLKANDFVSSKKMVLMK